MAPFRRQQKHPKAYYAYLGAAIPRDEYRRSLSNFDIMLKSGIRVNEYDEIHAAKKIRTCLATLGRDRRCSCFNIDLCRNEFENDHLTT